MNIFGHKALMKVCSKRMRFWEKQIGNNPKKARRQFEQWSSFRDWHLEKIKEIKSKKRRKK